MAKYLSDVASGKKNVPQPYNALITKVPVDVTLPAVALVVGDIIQLPTPGGEGQIGAVVRAVREDGALRLDFNHPLAGQPVTFEVHLIGVL